MYVVIVRATARVLDEDYVTTAALLREMALRDFGCLEFHAVTAGDQEIVDGSRRHHSLEGAS